jgi:hypothetical protein
VERCSSEGPADVSVPESVHVRQGLVFLSFVPRRRTMQPSIQLHDVCSLSLGDIVHFPEGDKSPAFVRRSLVVTDKDGHSFEIRIYADKPEQLMTPDEQSHCRPTHMTGGQEGPG